MSEKSKKIRIIADFMKLVRRIRSKVGKNPPTLKEITLEVEKVRTKRYKESASK